MTSKKVLVIVESPAKAKTIKKILGRNYEVKASVGHVMDLPKSRLGVDIENGFEPEYIKIRGKGKVIQELKKSAKDAKRVLLASDPDREGESIAWHIANILGIDKDEPCRVRVYEITPGAIKEAVKKPQPIDLNKVFAQQARRVLDRLVGYKLSPLLWEKVRSGLSAGRVQSVALRLICEREKEIQNFVPQEYWLIDCLLEAEEGLRSYKVRLKKKDNKSIKIPDQKTAKEIENYLKSADFVVSSFKYTPQKKNPPAPFKTSTLQQEASKKLGFSPQRTMRIAQQLYEGIQIPEFGLVGLITYMRTDSVRIAPEAQESARSFIKQHFGEDYLPQKPIRFVDKGKTQDAHEGIRPTDVFKTPESIKDYLTNDQYKLYDLIWKRFIASQMKPASLLKSTLFVEAGPYLLEQTGIVIEFESFGVVWPLEVTETELKPAKEGEHLLLKEILLQQKFTQPPPRYTESSLIKALEEQGVGRPSTYATIIQTLYDRSYVEREDRKLKPTELGMVVNDFLINHFPDIIDVSFTAKMEDSLDEVEKGQLNWKEVVSDFYSAFDPMLKRVIKEAQRVNIQPQKLDERCPKCGSELVIRQGRYGKFIACSAFPECDFKKPYVKDTGVKCPECGGRIVERKTRKKKIFYGCENYPSCKFSMWRYPVKNCSKCGGVMTLKPRSKTVLVCNKCGNEEKIEKN